MQGKKPAHLLASALALGALLTACGGGNGPEQAAAPAPPSTVPTSSASAPAPVVPEKAKDAATIAAALDAGKPRVWTAEDDPNKLLGRPGSYTSAASVRDKNADCDASDSGVACGASVEVFGSPSDAATRSSYIQGVLKGGGLGTEYHTVVGAALLRVTGDLTPKQAAAYAEKFKAAAAS